MFCRIGRLLANCTIVHLQKFSTINIHYTRKNILLNHFTRIKNDQIRRKSIFGFFGKETVEQIKTKDNVPDLFQLIYRNKMGNYLLGAQIFSTVFTGFVCIQLIVNNGVNELKFNEELARVDIGTTPNEVYIYIIALIVFCIALQVIVAKMPLRIYNYPKQNEYISIFYGALPGTTKRVTFNVSEIIKLQEPGILPWKESSYEIKDKGRIILIENFFRTPADLNIMLGYQKHHED